eukprot:TRINITY_DN17010_c0_g1_i1.p1 TRINITY_DN17010_c0_g1~~TRINITY_DN17010_c0_g1_i1.p1  ORF type:complete len:652 (+),score=153.16 TRINITY_DN17010_c0_g1_i1:122-2077(+)
MGAGCATSGGHTFLQQVADGGKAGSNGAASTACSSTAPSPISASEGDGSPAAQQVVHLESRVQELERLLYRQSEQLSELQKALGSVQKDSQRTVSVLQYNILASYLGRNTQPWFLYGADVSPAARETIFARFSERDEHGNHRNPWPAYVEGILTPAEISAVQELDEHFKWENRRDRLVSEIRRLDADVLSLVELDQCEFMAARLGDTWDHEFRKRPRRASADGCGIFWRRSKFEMAASMGLDLVDDTDDKGNEKRDRSCLMLLLRWRACGTPLIVVSTHLAKDPDNRAQTVIRVRQVTQIIQCLTDFAEEHQAQEAPVILLGDLNARHFGEIRGIARTVWQIKGKPMHQFLWSASDVPTGPTSITKARQCRIDVVQFLPSQLEVLEVVPVPRLAHGEVIPSHEHPSDHFPVCARFRLKDTYQKHRELAASWLDCVAGEQKVHPLTEAELWTAFEFFDRDRSSRIHRHDLEEACLDLKSNINCNVQRLLLDCFPNQEISYSNFIRAYEARLSHERMRCIGDLERAFQFFTKDSSELCVKKLEAVFREITPVSFSDEEVREMIRRMNIEEDQEFVNIHRFCEVVCHASFPHKHQALHGLDSDLDFYGLDAERRRPRSTSMGEGRTETKNIAIRLGKLHEDLNLGDRHNQRWLE